MKYYKVFIDWHNELITVSTYNNLKEAEKKQTELFKDYSGVYINELENKNNSKVLRICDVGGKWEKNV